MACLHIGTHLYRISSIRFIKVEPEGERASLVVYTRDNRKRLVYTDALEKIQAHVRDLEDKLPTFFYLRFKLHNMDCVKLFHVTPPVPGDVNSDATLKVCFFDGTRVVMAQGSLEEVNVKY